MHFRHRHQPDPGFRRIHILPPDNSEADIAQERKKAVNEVKDEIGGMAMEIASKVVEREIKEADHQDLIDEFIKNVGEAS